MLGQKKHIPVHDLSDKKVVHSETFKKDKYTSYFLKNNQQVYLPIPQQ